MGRLIGLKTWDRILEIFLDFWIARERPETDLGYYVGIYALNYVLMSRRPKISMEFGSTKRNR